MQNNQVALERRLSYRCLLIATGLTRQVAPLWETEYGLTVITWRVMAVIGRYEPLAAKDVVWHTSTDPFFVSRAIDQLLEQGYINRDVDPKDRRRLCLTLTKLGRTVHRRVEKEINRVEADLLSRLSVQQQTCMMEALMILTEAVSGSDPSRAQAETVKARRAVSAK